MATHHKAQLIEAEPPMVEILERMAGGLAPNARQILDSLGYYNEHDWQIPSQGSDLTKQEQQELEPIIRALAEAAATSVRMRSGVLISTLKKAAKKPSLHLDGQLPAAVQWEIAANYRRGEEKAGTYCMDIWGNEQTICEDPLETPTEANIKRAAEAAIARIQECRTSGRPPNSANAIIALQLGIIFRSSGQPVARRRQPHMSGKKLVFIEGGPFYDFLGLVLPTLNRYLREQQCPPVTPETVVRFVTEVVS
jgi:hypothetical protein